MGIKTSWSLKTTISAASRSIGGGPPVSRYVPLYEAKMIHQFDHRWASYDEDGENSTELSLTKKQNPNCEPSPRYWVPSKEVDERLANKDWTRRWLMGWRDITRCHQREDGDRSGTSEVRCRA